MTRCWCGGSTDATELICLESEFHDPQADGRPKEIKWLYIAGPMSGYPQNNYGTFNRAAARLRAVGFEVVNPAEFGSDGGRVHYTDLIREDLRALLDCDAVALLPRWYESHGARNEVNVAGMLKMPVYTVDHWEGTPMTEEVFDSIMGVPDQAAVLDEVNVAGECWVCDQRVGIKPNGRMEPHRSTDTKGLCGGSDLEWRDPIL